MSGTFDVAVVGATGLVGETLLAVLAQRKFPVGEVFALAGEDAVGEGAEFAGRELAVGDVAKFDFSRVQLVFFCAGAAVARRYAPRAAAAGGVAIDTSECFRDTGDVPLVVPEVNPGAISGFQERGVIASPGSAAVQLAVALKPLHDAVGLERVDVCTHYPVSASGRAAVSELATQTTELLNGRPAVAKVYPRQIAFNLLPYVDEFDDNGYTSEETALVRDTRRLLQYPELSVNATAVRVPVFFGQAAVVYLETRDKLAAGQARELLEKAPGVAILDTRTPAGYPTPVTEGTNHDLVYVGRIRDDISHPRGLNLWIVSDNVRKGAALNSVQIAEYLVKEHL